MSKLSTIWTPLLLVVLAFGLRLYQLGGQSLWIDEVYSLHQMAKSWSALLVPGGYAEIHPPLYYLTTKPLYGLALENRDWFEVILRLPAALFSALGAAAIFWLGTVLFDRRTGLLGGAMYAVSAYAVWYGQEVRMYSLALLLVVLQAILVLRTTKGKSGALEWLSLFVVSLAAPLTHWYSVFALPALVCYVALEKDRRAYLWQLLLVLLVSSSIAAIYLLPKMGGSDWQQTAVIDWKNLAYLIWSLWVGYSAGPSVVDLHSDPLSTVRDFAPSIALFASLAVAVAVCTFWAHRERGLSSNVMFLMAWALVATLGPLALAELTGKAHNARYSFTALPPILLLIASAATRTERNGLRVALITAFFTAQLWSLSNYYWQPYYSREDFRAAALALREAPQSRGRVLMSQATREVLAAYEITSWEWRDYLHYRPWSRDLRVAIENEAAELGTVWLVTGRRWWNDESRIHSFLSKHFDLIEHRKLVGLDIWVFGTRLSRLAYKPGSHP